MWDINTQGLNLSTCSSIIFYLWRNWISFISFLAFPKEKLSINHVKCVYKLRYYSLTMKSMMTYDNCFLSMLSRWFPKPWNQLMVQSCWHHYEEFRCKFVQDITPSLKDGLLNCLLKWNCCWINRVTTQIVRLKLCLKRKWSFFKKIIGN